MKKLNTKDLCISAVLMALVCVVTLFIQIPIPLGYFNIGNTIILIACVLVPMPYGILVGSIGSALADLLSFPIYTIPTLIIKLVFPLVFYLIRKIRPGKIYIDVLAAAVSTLVPLFGYTATGMILYGGFIAGIAQFPGLALEYVANLILFAIFVKPTHLLKKSLL